MSIVRLTLYTQWDNLIILPSTYKIVQYDVMQNSKVGCAR